MVRLDSVNAIIDFAREDLVERSLSSCQVGGWRVLGNAGDFQLHQAQKASSAQKKQERDRCQTLSYREAACFCCALSRGELLVMHRWITRVVS